MVEIRQVTMELLRQGPPHNQLLSPLTDYLALSGRHEATMVRVPFEHVQFMTMLRSLRYGDQGNGGDIARQSNLDTISKAISGMMAQVPGLIADLSSSQKEQEKLVHLRLVFSPSELAMLPFELAESPSGFPGEGQPLSMQQDSPIVMTREIRGAIGMGVNWVRTPKILFAFSNLESLPVPYKQHLLALRRAIDPWMSPLKGASKKDQLSEFLTILPNASMDDISRACEQESFTHVHILAHGMAAPHRAGKRFGLVMFPQAGKGEPDVVEGERLALALRTRHKGEPRHRSSPLVVTIAACDGGQQGGDVQWPGSSLAHSLHEAGIPLVVASQFPLSVSGSIVLTDALYQDFLWGRDPRLALHSARQKLRKYETNTHDWASLVAYTSLPPDINSQLSKLRTQQAQAAVRAALDRADAHHMQEGKNDADLDRHIQDLKIAMKGLPDTQPDFDTKAKERLRNRIELLGFMAGAQKRLAQTLYLASSTCDEDKKRDRNALIQQNLKDATTYYKRAYDLDPDVTWVGIQYLLLQMRANQANEREFKLDVNIWQHLYDQASLDATQGSVEDKRHAPANLAQLYFLAYGNGKLDQENDFDTKAIDQLKKLVEVHGYEAFEVRSTLRQFKRFNEMWDLDERRKDIAKEAIKCLSKNDA